MCEYSTGHIDYGSRPRLQGIDLAAGDMNRCCAPAEYFVNLTTGNVDSGTVMRSKGTVHHSTGDVYRRVVKRIEGSSDTTELEPRVERTSSGEPVPSHDRTIWIQGQ